MPGTFVRKRIKKSSEIITVTVFLRFYFSTFSLVLLSIEKIYQTLRTECDHIFKNLKYSAARRFFNTPLGVWKCGLNFDILRHLRWTMWNKIDGDYYNYLPVHYTSFVKKQQAKDNFCYIETGKQSHQNILMRFAFQYQDLISIKA